MVAVAVAIPLAVTISVSVSVAALWSAQVSRHARQEPRAGEGTHIDRAAGAMAIAGSIPVATTITSLFILGVPS